MAADFEVLEDGVPQKIDSFEHILPVRGPQTARTQPSSQRDMLQAVANPRNRIFLVFLDGPFVDDVHARAINEPLVKFLSTELADDDLVAIMTPNMSASQVTFGKKTEVLAETVRTAWWSWGRQNKELDPEFDKRQIQYTLCYPGDNDVPAKMIARSRERNTLEALQDAVNYLASIREERKAIIAVTEGWLLYREDPDLMRQREKEAPLGVDKMRVGPTGKLTLEDTKTSVNALSPRNLRPRARLSGEHRQRQVSARDHRRRESWQQHLLHDRSGRAEDTPRRQKRCNANARGEYRRPCRPQHQRSRQGAQSARRRHVVGPTSSATTRRTPSPTAASGRSPCA